MPKKIDITIDESLSDLRSHLRKAKSDRERGRLKALILLKEGKVEHQSHLASKLGFSEKTIREWLKTYSREGFKSFISIRVGGNNTKTISQQAVDFISDRFNNPSTTITSYVELQGLIEQELGESVHYGALYSHCRRNHKSKLKVSRKSHYKKDPYAEAVFKNLTSSL